MAGNNYKLLIEGKLDPSKIQQEIKALSGKSVLNVKVEFKRGDFDKFEKELARIKQEAASLSKVTLFGDQKGGINKAIVEYRDAIGNVVKETLNINKNVKITQSYTEDLVKDEREINRILERRAALTAKQNDELARAAHNADKFLEKSKNLNQTPSVQAAVGKAQQIKVAVSEGDVARVRELNREFDLMKARLQTGRTGLDSWTEGMRNAIKQTLEYALSIGLVYGALNQLKQGIAFVSELNSEMTKIQVLQVDGARTNEQIANLALQYNGLAKELSATTIQVAQGSVEWLRQGKTIEQTRQLLTATLMASKLGNMESAESTEYLTAILNGFQMESEEAITVVDKLIAVDNIAATSFAELAKAMQYSAAVANQTGVSFNSLVGYIATVSSTTRLAPEMIGQAFKTMFTRMEQVKAGAIDETGMSLNNVEKTLSNVGIKLRDTTNSFRPLEDVIHDVSLQWDTLTQVQQSQIANSIAGVRQANIFLTLMQNYKQYVHDGANEMAYLSAQTESAGLAQERYAIYAESVQAAQDRLTASWERLWMETVESGAITWFLDLGASMMDVISAGGGLKPLLMAVLGIFIAMKREAVASLWMDSAKAIKGIIPVIKSVIASMLGMQTTAVTTGAVINTAFGVIGLVITGISLAIMAFSAQSQKAMQAAQDLSQEVGRLHTEQNKLVQDSSKISELGMEYEKLKGIRQKSSEEEKRFLEVQNKLHELMPQLSGEYDKQGNFILDNSVNLTELIRLKNEELRLNKESLKIKIGEQIQAQTKAYEQQAKKLEKLVTTYERQQKLLQNTGPRYVTGNIIKPEDIDKQKLMVDDLVNQMKIGFYSLDKEQKKAQIEMLKNSGQFGAELAEQLEGLIITTSDLHDMENLYADKAKTNVSSLKLEYLELLEVTKQVSEMTSALTDAIGKSKKGELGFGDLENLAKVYPDYLKSLSVESGQLKINSDLLEQYGLEQIKVQIETAKANGATKEQIQVLEAQANSFQRSISMSKDFVDGFTEIMQATSENMSGESKEAFDTMAQSIAGTNQQFKEGQLNALQYFDILEQQLKSVNFSEMFAENQVAAQTFFTGMTTNAAQALYQMTTEFESGELSVLGYIDRLKELSDIFQYLGSVVQSSGEMMGMSSEQIASITESTDGLLSSVSELVGMYDLINITMAGMSQGLQFNTEAYNNWAMGVSKAMALVGGTWTDAAGNALNGSDAIFKYATAASGNMNVLVNQLVTKVNGVIQKATASVGKFLREIAKGISSFKGDIRFTPKLSGTTTFTIGIPGILELPFSLPQIGLEVGASVTGASNLLTGIAENIENWGASSPIDLGDFIKPGGIGASGDAVNNLSNALQGLTGSAGGAGGALKNTSDAAKDLKKNLDEVRKAAIDSLKAQLSGYKKIIDERKKLLDSMKKERAYQQDVEEKNNEILRIQSEMAALQFDTSEEAQARRLKLEDDLKKAELELENAQFDHSIETQKDALDRDYASFESVINETIKKIEGINATTVGQFTSQLATILSSFSTPTSGSNPIGNTPQYHEGGLVGGTSIRSNEVLAKLMRGELVVTAQQGDNFIKNILPQMAETSSNMTGGDINLDMPIQVAGNLDKSVIPDIDRIANKVIDKINSIMLSRGYSRRSDLYSTG